jgi:hypothetical protein
MASRKGKYTFTESFHRIHGFYGIFTSPWMSHPLDALARLF